MKNVSFLAYMFALPLLLAPLGASAETYRWTDAKGRVVISDTPPPGTAKSVQQAGSNSTADDGNLPFATRQAAANFPVTLYTAENCLNECRMARELLSTRNIPFTEKTLATPETAEELKQLVGDLGVPTLKVGRQNVHGFLADAYNNLLDLAGYPKKPGAGGGQ